MTHMMSAANNGDFCVPPPPILLPPLSIPPPPPLPPPPLHLPVFDVEKSKFFKMIAERDSPTVEGPEDIKKLLKNRKERCGLVALWMAGALLTLEDAVPLDTIVRVARERGYTAQGEMFSADSMALLAREVYHCGAELLSDGMAGLNRRKILCHLTSGYPVLVPCKYSILATGDTIAALQYDEDCNHEPCARGGHRAHWAVLSGVVLGLRCSSASKVFHEDPDMPGLFHPCPDSPCPPDQEVEEVFLLAKQGKSQRSQLWTYKQVCESNLQLLNLDPKRASDGKTYVLPEGGVKAGLCGKIVLLHPCLA